MAKRIGADRRHTRYGDAPPRSPTREGTDDARTRYLDRHPTEDRIVFGAGVVEHLDPTADVTNLGTVRPDGGLTLGRVVLDGSVEELGGLSPVAGAHPRQRPTP
jgi:hypothetical protein